MENFLGLSQILALKIDYLGEFFYTNRRECARSGGFVSPYIRNCSVLRKNWAFFGNLIIRATRCCHEKSISGKIWVGVKLLGEKSKNWKIFGWRSNFRLISENIQGDPKQRPPLPGRSEKCSMKTEDSIFKYNLFNNYSESFMLHNQLFTSEWVIV